MNSQELRALQEAYMDVYGLDEASGGIIGGKTFPSKNVPEKSKPNKPSKIGRGIRKSIHSASFGFSQEKPKDIVSRHKEYTDNELDTVSRGKDEPKPGKGRSKSAREFQLRVIEREKRRRQKANEETDLYDIILSHLLDEGYADTQEQAEVIMVNMSEDWRESIFENVSSGKGRVTRYVQSRPTGPVTNRELDTSRQRRMDTENDRIKKIGDEAHAAATSKGLSFGEAEFRRKRAELRARKNS
jgi:hypothetical protein